MELDLNDQNFTLEDVRQLIASKDNSVERELRVTLGGIAFISDVTGPVEKDNVYFRLSTWEAGFETTGFEAAKNDRWVSRIYKCLKDNWPERSTSYIETY